MSLRDIAKRVHAISNEEDPEKSFLTMLNEHISRTNPERTPSKSYKPSSMGTCYRQNYYQLTGQKIDPSFASPDLVGMGESGTDRHERIQKYVSGMEKNNYPVKWVKVSNYLKMHPHEGVEVRGERGFETQLDYKPLNMHLQCDGIIQIKGVYYILEIKTESDFKWLPRHGPAKDHLVQAAAYSLVLGIDKVLFLYENRNVCAKKAYMYDVSEEERQNIITFINRCNSYIDKQVLPPKTDNKSDCKYCHYVATCNEAGDGTLLDDSVLLGVGSGLSFAGGEDHD